jgi:hypothetical protein
MYRINGGEWQEYFNNFTLSGPNGEHLIEFHGIDYLGNAEEVKSVTVNLVNLEIDSYFTNCPDGYFDVIFKYDKKKDWYELKATNPGSFHYQVDILNTWPILLENLTYFFTLPDEFYLVGGNPIHIYLDGADITSQCVFNDSSVVLFNIPASALISVKFHLKYGLKGSIFSSLEEFAMQGYQFLNCVTAFCGHPSVAEGGLLGSYSTIGTLVAHQKKVTALAGYVYSSDGAPISGAAVELFDESGILVSLTSTDETGFFYFLDLEVGVYSLQVVFQDFLDLSTVTTIRKEVVVLEIYLE